MTSLSDIYACACTLSPKAARLSSRLMLITPGLAWELRIALHEVLRRRAAGAAPLRPSGFAGLDAGLRRRALKGPRPAHLEALEFILACVRYRA